MDEVRLIDAKKLEAEILDWQNSTTSKAQYDAYENALDEIFDLPTIDPESLRPVARLKQTDIFLWTENYTCTRCEEILVLEDGTKEVNEYKYCPFCGAKIEGIDREEADEE